MPYIYLALPCRFVLIDRSYSFGNSICQRLTKDSDKVGQHRKTTCQKIWRTVYEFRYQGNVGWLYNTWLSSKSNETKIPNYSFSWFCMLCTSGVQIRGQKRGDFSFIYLYIWLETFWGWKVRFQRLKEKILRVFFYSRGNGFLFTRYFLAVIKRIGNSYLFITLRCDFDLIRITYPFFFFLDRKISKKILYLPSTFPRSGYKASISHGLMKRKKNWNPNF